MFQINDCIIYGCNGACSIIDVRNEKDYYGVMKEHYVLQPVYLKTSTIMTPVDNEKVIMRGILTLGEAEELICNLDQSEIPWIDNDKVRNREYRELQKSCVSTNWIQLVRTIYTKKQEKISEGKKLSQADEIIIQGVEKLLFGELAISMKTEVDTIKKMVLKKIDQLNFKA